MGGGEAGGEAGLEEVAAGWRLPIEHLAAGVDARKAAELERGIELAEGDPASAGDGAVQALDAGDRQRRALDRRREGGRVGGKLRTVRLAEETDRLGRETDLS